MTGRDRASMHALGIAALVVTGLLAGVLVVLAVPGQTYQTVGLIASGDRAYEIPLSQDRVRFTLQAAGQATPYAGFALYDPGDGFFGYFELEGPGDSVDVLADRDGRWVVLVNDAEAAHLNVQLAVGPGSDASENVALTPIEVRTFERMVARQDGGLLDTQLALRLDERPAMAMATYRGQAQDLHIAVESPEGVVHEVLDGQGNRSDQADGSPSTINRLTPGNLAAGTYDIQATAEAFSGEIRFVHKVYDRQQPLVQQIHRVDTDQPLDVLLEEGTVVAQIGAMEPVAIHSQGAEQLLFAAEEHTRAQVLIFDASDRVIAKVDLGGRPGPSFDWEQDDGSGNGTAEASTLGLRDQGIYTVVVREIYGSGDQVHVVLPDVEDAQPGHLLTLQETRLELGGPSTTRTSGDAEVTVHGGLVDVEADPSGPAHASTDVRIRGPHGPVYELSSSAGVAGLDLDERTREHPANFTKGPHEISWETGAPTGAITVTFTSYHG